jgi:hypothetical protein
MALSSGLMEALTQFVESSASEGPARDAANQDLRELQNESHRSTAEYEDCAFGILARLYGAPNKTGLNEDRSVPEPQGRTKPGNDPGQSA